MAVTDHDAGGHQSSLPVEQRGPAGTFRYQRIAIDQPDLQFAIEVHPRLTIVAVPNDLVARTARTLTSALTSDEPGVHCELTDPDGRNLLLFRPHGGRSRVIDLDTQGEVDPLALPPMEAQAAEDNGAVPTAAEVVRRLSGLDQAPLWTAAARLSAASRQGAQVLQEVESKATSSGHRFPFGRKGRERKSGRTNKTVSDALAVLEQAGERWRSIAGDIPLHVALALRPGIEACADARGRTAALATMAAGRDDHLSEQALESTVEVVAALLARDPNLPEVLVLPPPNVGRLGLQLMLDVMPGLLVGRQVMMVTTSVDIVDWGRLESHADRASVTIFGA
jgi:hypothetical protein